MVKKYPKNPSQSKTSENGPSIEALRFIVNYSKSVDVLKNGKSKVLTHLN